MKRFTKPTQAQVDMIEKIMFFTIELYKQDKVSLYKVPPTGEFVKKFFTFSLDAELAGEGVRSFHYRRMKPFLGMKYGEHIIQIGDEEFHFDHLTDAMARIINEVELFDDPVVDLESKVLLKIDPKRNKKIELARKTLERIYRLS